MSGLINASAKENALIRLRAGLNNPVKAAAGFVMVAGQFFAGAAINGFANANGLFSGLIFPAGNPIGSITPPAPAKQFKGFTISNLFAQQASFLLTLGLDLATLALSFSMSFKDAEGNLVTFTSADASNTGLYSDGPGGAFWQWNSAFEIPFLNGGTYNIVAT